MGISDGYEAPTDFRSPLERQRIVSDIDDFLSSVDTIIHLPRPISDHDALRIGMGVQALKNFLRSLDEPVSGSD